MKRTNRHATYAANRNDQRPSPYHSRTELTSCTHIPIPESLPDSNFPPVNAFALFSTIRALTMPDARYGLILDEELPSQLFRDEA